MIEIGVPEGLPLAVTTILSFVVQRLRRENILVRYLQAYENMGFVNEICTDKTEVLTQNKMTATGIFT